MKHLPPSIEATLTRMELAAPFSPTEPDNDPLPRLTRLACLWEGGDWIEVDPATGQIDDASRQEAAE